MDEHCREADIGVVVVDRFVRGGRELLHAERNLEHRLDRLALVQLVFYGGDHRRGDVPRHDGEGAGLHLLQLVVRIGRDVRIDFVVFNPLFRILAGDGIAYRVVADEAREGDGELWIGIAVHLGHVVDLRRDGLLGDGKHSSRHRRVIVRGRRNGRPHDIGSSIGRDLGIEGVVRRRASLGLRGVGIGDCLLREVAHLLVAKLDLGHRRVGILAVCPALKRGGCRDVGLVDLELLDRATDVAALALDVCERIASVDVVVVGHTVVGVLDKGLVALLDGNGGSLGQTVVGAGLRTQRDGCLTDGVGIAHDLEVRRSTIGVVALAGYDQSSGAGIGVVLEVTELVVRVFRKRGGLLVGIEDVVVNDFGLYVGNGASRVRLAWDGCIHAGIADALGSYGELGRQIFGHDVVGILDLANSNDVGASVDGLVVFVELGVDVTLLGRIRHGIVLDVLVTILGRCGHLHCAGLHDQFRLLRDTVVNGFVCNGNGVDDNRRQSEETIQARLFRVLHLRECAVVLTREG